MTCLVIKRQTSSLDIMALVGPVYFMIHCIIKYTGPTNAIMSRDGVCVYFVNVQRQSLILAPSGLCHAPLEMDEISKYIRPLLGTLRK